MGATIGRIVFGLCVGSGLAACWPVGAAADDDLARRASWSVPAPEQVRAALDVWLQTQHVDEGGKREIEAIWVAAGVPTAGRDVLERVASTVALLDDDARRLTALVNTVPPPLILPKFAILESESVPPVVRSNLRLLLGRWLAQNDFYDEAHDQLADLTVQEVADPASLLFYRSVARHVLLMKAECLQDVEVLMQNEGMVPRRFQTVARLMQADLAGLKPDSLDEVARLMDDIRRRLEFGRAGTRVRKEEEDVIAKLDKMIEELEKQQQQQQQQASAGGSSPSNPRPDSTPGGVQGPGDVDPKNTGNKSGWGNLPAKERQEALQNIAKDLPAHFRDAIEEYFRKMAHDGVKK